MKGWCVSFLHKDCFLLQTICCFKRYAHNEIKQPKKHTFQELKVTRLLLDGEIWTQPR